MLSDLAEEPLEALPHGSLGIAKVRVERGEIRKLAGPREHFE